MSRYPQQDVLEQEQMARGVVQSFPTAARVEIVNRTHRVVRAQARSIQARRSRARSLWLPMLICSALLILTCLAVWTGLYQYQVAEAVEADVTALAATEMNNHFLVALLWFVPVSAAVLATVWVRRSRNHADDEAL